MNKEENTNDSYFNSIVSDAMNELKARRTTYLFSGAQVEALKLKIEKYNNEKNKMGELKHPNKIQISVRNDDGVYIISRHDRKIKV